MPVFEKFEQIDNETFFKELVKDHFENSWANVSAKSGSRLETSDELISLAYKRYCLNIQQYTVALKSKNPDHYKRAGALLHALYVTKPVKRLVWDKEITRLTNAEGVGVSYADAEFWNSFTDWYDEYCCQMMSFDLAFRCCQIYEGIRHSYSQDFLDNMCYYMAENTNINVGSFVVIFKAYWAFNQQSAK